jgi:hypothetical protein
MEVSAPAPQKARRWFTNFPDMAEFLAVVALRERVLSSISLHPDSNVAEARQTENFLERCLLCKVTRKSDRFITLDSSGGDRRVAVICLTLTTSKPRLTSPSEVAYHRLYGILGFWKEGVIL